MFSATDADDVDDDDDSHKHRPAGFSRQPSHRLIVRSSAVGAVSLCVCEFRAIYIAPALLIVEALFDLSAPISRPARLHRSQQLLLPLLRLLRCLKCLSKRIDCNPCGACGTSVASAERR